MKFYKYTGLGNTLSHKQFKCNVDIDSRLAKAMCDRHFGIGRRYCACISSKSCDIRMEIYNFDGSIAEMCGMLPDALQSFT